jgi:uncharacterized phage protein gp47/JayE
MPDSNQDYLDQYDYVDSDFFYEAIEEYSPLIGTFLMNFSLLERELNQAISEIIQDRTHETGYIIISQLNMGKKIEVFHKLYLQLETATDGKHRKKLEAIKGKLIALNSFRNQIAHADWGTLSKEHNVRIKIQADTETGFVKFKLACIKPEDIESNTEEIDKVIDEIDEYKEEAFSF